MRHWQREDVKRNHEINLIYFRRKINFISILVFTIKTINIIENNPDFPGYLSKKWLHDHLCTQINLASTGMQEIGISMSLVWETLLIDVDRLPNWVLHLRSSGVLHQIPAMIGIRTGIPAESKDLCGPSNIPLLCCLASALSVYDGVIFLIKMKSHCLVTE